MINSTYYISFYLLKKISLFINTLNVRNIKLNTGNYYVPKKLQNGTKTVKTNLLCFLQRHNIIEFWCVCYPKDLSPILKNLVISNNNTSFLIML